MNALEIFNKTKARLYDGNGRAWDLDRRICKYRAEDGNKCAVGNLILDSEYIPNMEQMLVADLAAKGLLPERLRPHLDLLMALQELHDTILNWNGNKLSEKGEAELAEIEKDVRKGNYP